MKYIDYYDVLGVKRGCDDQEIKKAYRKLAKQWHPDRHKGEAKKKAEEKFKQINEAYEALGDPEKRKKYDSFGSNWQTGQEFNYGDFKNNTNFSFQSTNGFSDFFSAVFSDIFSDKRSYTDNNNRFSGSNYEEQVEESNASIEIPVDQLLMGTQKRISIKTDEKIKTIEINIPQNSLPNSILRLSKIGNNGGVLLLKLKPDPSGVWRLSGNYDIVTSITIYPEQAVLGCKKIVNLPTGKIEINIPPNTRSGKILRISGQSFKRKNGKKGDALLKILIDIPAFLSEKKVEFYKKIAEI